MREHRTLYCVIVDFILLIVDVYMYVSWCVLCPEYERWLVSGSSHYGFQHIKFNFWVLGIYTVIFPRSSYMRPI